MTPELFFGSLSILLGVLIEAALLIHVTGYFTRKKRISVSARIVISEARISGEGFYPHVVYSYELNGRHYESSAIGIFNMESMKFLVRRVLAKYPVNMPVTAFVDPDNPSDALLETAIPAWTVVMLFFAGAALMAMGFMGLMG